MSDLYARVLTRLHEAMAAQGIAADAARPAGSGPCFQLARVQRRDPRDRRHRAEFTRLAWRQPGFTLATLMAEAAAVTARALGDDSGEPWRPELRRYRDAWQARIGIDPLAADGPALRATSQRLGLNEELGTDRRAWLELLFTRFIEPTLGYDVPLLLTEFPVELAGSARLDVNEDGQPVARRFRLYIEGLALVSGQEDEEGGGSAGLGVERVLMVLADVRDIGRILAA